jgi:LysR family glycine cleavage system transcriptional activator
LTLGLKRLKEESSSNVLTVTVNPVFAAKWLLPRIDRFQPAHPDTDLGLETSLVPVDFVAQRIDVGARYGTGHWPGLVAHNLRDEEVYPACSPALAERVKAARQRSSP